ncbi:Crp/Fnr family transcriptional regulator [Acinetobacter puyangensis]|uniref:Crp/Fnr family transcriptional regulator n=1 Tax=Acinetobacter puyangensis TaxID=1096779 RepID=UPI003A4D917A
MLKKEIKKSLSSFIQLTSFEKIDNKNYIRQDQFLMDIAKEIILGHTIAQYLNKQELQKLFDNLKFHHYHHHQVVYRHQQKSGDIFLILQGSLQLSWHAPDGRQIIHQFLPAGCMINIIPVITGLPMMHDHIAHHTTIIATIPGKIFLELTQSNAKVSFEILKMIACRSHFILDDIYYHKTRSLRVRLARQLFFLLNYFSHQRTNSPLTIKLSQENFAELLQTTRQSISKELLWLAQQSIAEVKYNQIHILDIEKLETLAYSL